MKHPEECPTCRTLDRPDRLFQLIEEGHDWREMRRLTYELAGDLHMIVSDYTLLIMLQDMRDERKHPQ